MSSTFLEPSRAFQAQGTESKKRQIRIEQHGTAVSAAVPREQKSKLGRPTRHEGASGPSKQ